MYIYVYMNERQSIYINKQVAGLAQHAGQQGERGSEPK